jgi:parallel beta-helix repeat protein
MGINLKSGRRMLVLTLLLTAATAVAGVSAASAKTLYVSKTGRNHGSACTKRKPCKTINAAIGKAHSGDLVQVAKGSYTEDVTLTKKLDLVGIGRPTIQAVNLANGIFINGAAASGSRVSDFLVENALDEGILAMKTAHVTIANNIVKFNDKGAASPTPTGECKAQGQVPGDCGEGIHLMTVANAMVLNNTVTGNTGGILLSDEFGPTDANTVSGNQVLNNVLDCGITVVGHNTNAVSSTGLPQPSQAGVYGNRIHNNTANGNGTKGQGGGILLAAGAPGSGVYNNTVDGNTANNNGLGGLTLHSHAPNQDLNGNKIVNNTFSHDGLNGYPNGAAGDSDAGITQTFGIDLFSAVGKLTGLVVTGNHLSNEYYGIWTKNVPTIPLSSNTFDSSVTVDEFQS